MAIALNDSKKKDLIDLAHFLASPFIYLYRFMRLIAKGLAFCLILASWWLFVNVAWVAGIGPHGYSSRSQYNDAIESTNEYFPAGPLEIHFGDHYQGTPGATPEKNFQYVAPLTVISPTPSGGQNVPGYPALCQGRVNDLAEMTYNYRNIGSWKSRSRLAILRKSTKMEQALIRAQYMASELRGSLAEMKQPLKTTSVLIHHPINYVLCSQISNDTPFQMPELYDSSNIHMNHMPVINMAYRYNRITGMCLKDHCKPEDFRWKITYYADLFSKEPVLTDGQEEAIAAMDKLGDKDFWLHAAHENGIVGRDERVIGNWEFAHEGVERVLTHAYDGQASRHNDSSEQESFESRVEHWSEEE